MDALVSKLHFQPHTGITTNEVSQPTEQLILDRNKDLRNNKGVINDLGGKNPWGRQLASIPFIIFEKAIRQGFKLNSLDKDEAGLEMHRFLKTPMGKSCLV